MLLCMFVLLILTLPAVTLGQPACTESASNQTQLQDFLNLANSGQKQGAVLCLEDGNSYTRIHTTPDFQGTSNAPITIRARNDGQVTFHSGEERVFDLQGSYGRLIGVNGEGGDNQALTARGENWLVQRVVVWHSRVQTGETVGMAGHNNTLEDVAIFGYGRYIVSAGAGTADDTGNILRRVWMRGEGRDNDVPQATAASHGLMLGYAGQSSLLAENVIVTYDFHEPAFWFGNESAILFSNTRSSRLFGSIAYAPPGAFFGERHLLGSYSGEVERGWTLNNQIRDVVSVASSARADFSSFVAWELFHESWQGNALVNVVGLTGVAGGCGWSGCTPGPAGQLHHGTTRAAVLNTYPDPKPATIWDAVPGICKRVVNGVQTQVPLWPWPMQQRLTNALNQSGRANVNIQQILEGADMLGPMPASCQTGDQVPVATSLGFSPHPTQTQVNVPMGQSVIVKVYNQSGGEFDAFTGTITLTFAPGTNAEGATMSGPGCSGTGSLSTCSVQAVQGDATFANLQFDTVSTDGYQLRASATLNGQPVTVDSLSFAVTTPPVPLRILRWVMGEGSPATTLTDTGDVGTYTGTFGAGATAPAWVTGPTPGSQALAFTAAQQDIVTNNSITWNIKNPVTVVAWVRTVGAGGSNQGLFVGGNDEEEEFTIGAVLRSASNQLIWQYGQPSVGGQLSWTWGAQQLGVWTRIALVGGGLQENALRIYVNGSLVASTTYTANPGKPDRTSLRLGKFDSQTTTGDWCNCEVADFAIHNVPWQDADAQADAEVAPPPAGLSGKPWSMFFGRN